MKGIAGALAALALIALPGLGLAKESALKLDRKRIERSVAGMVDSGRTVGASVLVWQGGKERLFTAAGLADREAARPFLRDTLVQIFSMTKPVTGVALMQLWEQGKFGLDDPVARHLPELANLQVADGAALRAPARAVTVRDVLRHTAGFTYGGGEGPADRVWAEQQPLALSHDLAEFGRRLGKVPLLADPGTRWHYSAAVDVQALLVERLSGQKFADYVRDHIFRPLGMNDSAWRRSPADRARFAALYQGGETGPLTRVGDKEWLESNFMDAAMTMGGSGIVCTVDDYMRFARMLLGKGSLDGVRVLKPSTLQLMATDQLDPRITERLWLPGKGAVGFGFDFAVRVKQPQTPEEARGAVGEFFWDGYPSMLFWVDPANDLAVVFATQKIPFDATLHRTIREAVYGKGYLGPKGD